MLYHVSENHSFFFLRLNKISLCACSISCLPIQLLMDIGLFLRFDYCDDASVNVGHQIHVQVPSFSYFGYILRSRIVRPYGESLLRNHYTLFCSCCTILNSHQQYTRVLILYILTNICYFLSFC